MGKEATTQPWKPTGENGECAPSCRDGKNDVIVRYFSQNHGFSVTNAPPFLMCIHTHNTPVLFFSLLFSFIYDGLTVM